MVTTPQGGEDVNTGKLFRKGQGMETLADHGVLLRCTVNDDAAITEDAVKLRRFRAERKERLTYLQVNSFCCQRQHKTIV